MWTTALTPAVLLALTVLAAGQPPAAERLFTHTSHHFGVVPRGAQLLHRFPWTNTEASRLEVTELRVNCGCATATPVPRVLEPGQTGAIEVLVDAKKFVGDKTIAIHLMIGPDNPRAVVLQVSAHCRPDIVYNPGSVSFGVVPQGSAPTQIIDVEYAGMLDWRVEEVVNPSPHLTATLQELYRRPGQAGYRLTVGLKPDAPPGDFKQELQLRTNDPASPVAPVLVEAMIRSRVTVTPDPLSLGSIPAGQAVVRRVTVRGEQPFRILRIEGTTDRLQVSAPPVASAVHSLVVSWHPTAAGELNQQLLLYTDLDKSPVIPVRIQGQAGP